MTTEDEKKTPEIEITLEMINAGVEELGSWVSPEDYRVAPSDLVKWVYSAMAKCAPSCAISMDGNSQG
jgi:hypothetical protein